MRAAKLGAIVVLTRSLDICTVLRCPVLWLLPACPRITSPFRSKRKRFLAPWWRLAPCFQRTHSVVGLSSAGGDGRMEGRGASETTATILVRASDHARCRSNEVMVRVLPVCMCWCGDWTCLRCHSLLAKGLDDTGRGSIGKTDRHFSSSYALFLSLLIHKIQSQRNEERRGQFRHWRAGGGVAHPRLPPTPLHQRQSSLYGRGGRASASSCRSTS